MITSDSGANLTDAPGESLLSRFFELLHSYVARALNSHFGRGENLWRQPDSFDNSEIHDVETLEEQRSCILQVAPPRQGVCQATS